MSHYRLLCLPFLLLVTSSCGDAREFIREKYTGERKGAPVVGARRAPVLNPAAAVSAAAPSPQKIVPTKSMADMAPSPAGKIEMPSPKTSSFYASADEAEEGDAFNQYDEHGNSKKGKGKNYLKEWFGGEKAAPEQKSQAVASVDSGEGRKSFKGSLSARPVDAPARSVPIVPSAPAVTSAPDAAPAVKAPLPVEDEGNGVIIPRVPKRSDNQAPAHDKSAGLQQMAQLAPASGNPNLPSLRDVPEKPKAFKGIKASKDADQQDLMDTHDKAMNAKKELAKEPTDLDIDDVVEEIKGALESPTPIVTAQR